MRKHVLSWVLILAMVIALVGAVPAGAADDDFVIEDGVLGVYNGPGGDVVIPDSVTKIGDRAFFVCDSVTSVTIPSSVTSIGEQAFFGCGSLTDFYVDSGNANFCSQNGVLFNKDGSELIQYPIGKTDASYSIPYGVSGIGVQAFSNSILNSVTIPDSVTSIGEKAFSYCFSLTNMTIGSNVTSIGDSAFCCCHALTSVTIPDSVTSIGELAFIGCDSLNSVTIGKNVTSIDTGTFDGCTSLTALTIPDSVTRIGMQAFANCTSLTSMTIPNSVTSIDERAFESCHSLASVTMSENVTSIGDWAFYGCTSLTSIVLPESLSTIDEIALGYFGETEHVPGFTIYGFSGTEAERYAVANGFIFVALGEHISTATSFTDVPAGAFYTDAVAWAVSKNITKGTSATTFGPDDNCTRGHIVTFLWRAKGSPEPKTTDCPFVDVSPKGFYYKAMLWAVENGITKGLDATHFGPEEPCNRAQAVTFLWRAEGSPAPSSGSTVFTDVSPKGFYYQAMLWAGEESITKGTSPTTFGPDDTCSRGHIVTFLYRDLAK